jgi:beta-glucosidase
VNRNPAAILPHDVGNLPMLYDDEPSANRGYLFADPAPVIRFGRGLSYTRFEVAAPRIPASAAPPGVGAIVYAGPGAGRVPPPVDALDSLEPPPIGPGATRTVAFTLGPRAFRFWYLEMRRAVDPAGFDILAGAAAIDLKAATFQLRS